MKADAAAEETYLNPVTLHQLEKVFAIPEQFPLETLGLVAKFVFRHDELTIRERRDW